MSDWLSHSADRAPGALAVRAPEGDVTYAELAEGAARAAGRLAAHGVRRGDRVAVTLAPGRAFAELLHAMPLLGTVLVPLNTRLSAAELRAQVEQAAPRIVVEEPLDGPGAELPAQPGAAPGDAFTLLFTSGSTARPKPVVLTYANHAASAAASHANLPLGPDDRWLCVLPLFHVGGLAILVRCAIAGACAVVHDGFHADAVRRSLESGEATLASLVPTMLRRLAAAGLREAPALRAALLGGGPIPRDLLDWARAHGIPVLPTYGMTETASQVVTGDGPLPGVELRIGPGGEILLRGPMVSEGALAADGWLHTGDRGSLDPAGRLHVEGRLKEVIVTGGENVSMAEVEEALLAHPAVADAGVAGRPDTEWGEVVVAHVVVAGDVSDHDLAAHCRALLAGYKVPKAFVRHESLPRNAAGKLLRGRLSAV
ncbi:MAG: AMP-binding protein [Thermoleophilaceae bacterium]